MNHSFTHVPAGAVLRLPLPTSDMEIVNGEARLTIPFAAYAGQPGLIRQTSTPLVHHILRVRAYGDHILRISFDPVDHAELESEMLNPETMPKPQALSIRQTGDQIELRDPSKRVRARFNLASIPTRQWSDLLPPGEKLFEAEWFPDAVTKVPMASYDRFAHGITDSVALGYLEQNGRIEHTLFSFQASSDERFAGTGERFAKMDLSGKTITLENDDGLGVNSRRTYKNIPFFLSSRPYGLFVHSSNRIHLSLADLSTRAAQGLVEDDSLDLFLCGGGSSASILHNYVSLTGLAPDLPTWSYGIWMSRMTYYSAEEVQQVAQRLRDEDYPCDVLHLDTGWFPTDWVCDWQFSPESFPEPASWMAGMRQQGFRITLWQTPDISEQSRVSEHAQFMGYLPRVKEKQDAGSDFSRQGILGPIDFSHPGAVQWYQNDLILPLLKLGASAIKTDFGENIPMQAEYHGLTANKLRNRYALLYQKSAFECTRSVFGEGQSLIWARAAWAGCQRYPVHWGGDAECSWEGMAATIRGGLHLGLSGFTYWSHDVPGFHGTPDFMNSWPSDNLYMRWTQLAVFSSHIRYHGCSPREPYEYPAIANRIRTWWKLRYALIPYIMEQANLSASAGLPVFRALILADEPDTSCWHIDDQYLFGNDFIVAPIMNDEGLRDVYLPAGSWIDFWTGEHITGGQWLRKLHHDLSHLPVFVREGASLPIYPEPVSCSDDMHPSKIIQITVNEGFGGLPVCRELWNAQPSPPQHSNAH
ncbi:alpha-xylosidase [Verrucomicrobiaceae bacterium N1E253]|uniref:Alpha-xylosidase n=1 Tax=Oceaniferula marina TaxID=2748318 RepID=A0A851GCC9_9BACT|nr:alpha-xylosidase [Oceaniferula marina]NWK55233.1 alpha-xylosidase [Oceaniferula marina]